MKVVLYYHPVFLEHITGPGHPERPERLRAVMNALERSGIISQIEVVEPERADVNVIKQVHDPDYVDYILSLSGKSTSLDPDTRISPQSVESALRACGAVLQGVQKVTRDQGTTAFCLVRPPGHHAERDRAMGFCLFNNVAIAANWALESNLAERMLIFDPDLHHGNGTQWAFYETSRVFYISIHRYPYYPGTGSISENGRGEGEGYTANVPLPGGMGDDDYQYVAQEVVVPAIKSYSPDLVIFSAGFDAHALDPLGDMNVTSEGFKNMYSEILKELTQRRVPFVFALEGGYSLDGLSESILLLTRALLGEEFDAPHEIRPSNVTEEVVSQVKKLTHIEG